MKKLILILFAFSAVLMAQQKSDEPVVAIPIEKLFGGLGIPQVTSLKLDLLVQRRATLQARSEWLDSERQLLALEMDRHNSDVNKLQNELDSQFKCSFDMDARKCAPAKPENKEN